MKLNIDKTLDDIVSLKNQIDGLNMLLNNKKQIMSRFFDESGQKNASNDEVTVYVQERTKVTYDIPKLNSLLEKDITKQIIDKTFTINDWDSFVSFMKEKGIKAADIKQFFNIDSKVNEKKLNELYDQGVIDINNIKECCSAEVTKSIAIKMKHSNPEIPVN